MNPTPPRPRARILLVLALVAATFGGPGCTSQDDPRRKAGTLKIAPQKAPTPIAKGRPAR